MKGSRRDRMEERREGHCEQHKYETLYSEKPTCASGVGCAVPGGEAVGTPALDIM